MLDLRQASHSIDRIGPMPKWATRPPRRRDAPRKGASISWSRGIGERSGVAWVGGM